MLFEKKNGFWMQLGASALIMLQIFVTIMGGINGHVYTLPILAFYVIKMYHFFVESCDTIKMAQSNMVCLVLAGLAINAMIWHNNLSIYSAIQAALLIADAYIGTTLFALNNELAIAHYLFPDDSKAMKRIRSPLIAE